MPKQSKTSSKSESLKGSQSESSPSRTQEEQPSSTPSVPFASEEQLRLVREASQNAVVISISRRKK